MTDNGSAYRAHKHRLACHQLGLKHLFTRPYRPRTNGKAERFIQTLTGAGPTAASTPTAPSAPQRSTPGSTTTTSSDPRQPRPQATGSRLTKGA